MPTSEPNITIMVETFAFQITAAVEASMADRIQAALAGVFGAPPKRGPGRPAKRGVAHATVLPEKRKPIVTRVKNVSEKRKPIVTRVKVVSEKVARARKLQGQYMGALKSLKGADRAKVRAVAKEKGVAEAVKMAAGMKKGKA
jgi:hypothetical protein